MSKVQNKKIKFLFEENEICMYKKFDAKEEDSTHNRKIDDCTKNGGEEFFYQDPLRSYCEYLT